MGTFPQRMVLRQFSLGVIFYEIYDRDEASLT